MNRMLALAGSALTILALWILLLRPTPVQADWTQDYWCDEGDDNHWLSSGIVYWGDNIHGGIPGTCYPHSNVAIG